MVYTLYFIHINTKWLYCVPYSIIYSIWQTHSADSFPLWGSLSGKILGGHHYGNSDKGATDHSDICPMSLAQIQTQYEVNSM